MRTEPLLVVDDVVVQFGGVTAVNHASFVAESGRVTGLIGPNGAGKTTCFNVISGLQKPTRGRVRFNGRNVSHTPVHRRAKRGMGRTFQRLEAFGSLSVRDNVRVAHDIHTGLLGLVRPARADVEGLLERVGISAYADERADSVPTGVARLLELARCLAGDPQLLLLDEPSSGQDESETETFGALLRDLAAEGRGVLMVEHDMSLVMSVCDEIHVLDFGEVIATGSPAEIRNDPKVQQAYLGYSDQASTRPGAHAATPEETRTDLQPVELTATIPAVPGADPPTPRGSADVALRAVGADFRGDPGGAG
jgi:branched-chain amino acid transport system ATP-binding protein